MGIAKKQIAMLIIFMLGILVKSFFSAYLLYFFGSKITRIWKRFVRQNVREVLKAEKRNFDKKKKKIK